jgi:serine/threonine-protein kinase
MSIARSLYALLAALAALNACRETPPAATPVLRLTLAHPDELGVNGGASSSFGLTLAPDGRRLVVPASDDGQSPLWLRDLSTEAMRPLAGTTGGTQPFWSPEGDRLGFFAAGRLRVLSLATGVVQDLADAPSPAGGTWLADGEIVFAPRVEGALMRRGLDGRLAAFTTLADGESGHGWPHLAGTTHVVFFVRAREPARQGIWIAPREQPGARKRLVGSDAHGIVVDTALMYASGDALVAQPMNLETLTLIGRSQVVGPSVGRSAEHQLLATSGGDLLIFGVAAAAFRELQWVDRTGAGRGTLGEPMHATDVRIAPDGARVAVARVDPQLRTLDIWTYSDRQPIPRRLSPAIDADEAPAWSPDGRQLAWVSGRRAVTVRDSQAERSERVLRKFDNPVRITQWTSNGQWIVLAESRSGSGTDILLLSTTPGTSASDNGAAVREYARAPFNETFGTVSADGRWLAYASDESGAMEVYVDSFPVPGRRARLSVGGGTEPRWSLDGGAVFFRRGPEVHQVRLDIAGGAPQAASSERLFRADADIRSFDVAPDGQRFLLNVPAPARTAPLTVLVHVRSLLPSAP